MTRGLLLVKVAAAVLLLIAVQSRFRSALATNMAAAQIVHEGQPAISTSFLAKARQLSPHNTSAQRLTGYSLLRDDQAEAAVGVLEPIASSDLMASFWLGEAYASLGQRPEAISAWRQARSASYFLQWGQVAYEAEDYVTACTDYLIAVEIAPEMSLAHMYAGHCYYRRGEFDLAETSYRQAIALDPVFGFPYLHLARLLYYDLHRPDDALVVLEQCLQYRVSDYWRERCLQAKQGVQ